MLNWNEIEVAFLDMDGTLLDLHFDNFFWREHLPHRYARIRGLPTDQARAELHDRIERLQGRLEWYCIDYWSDQLGVDVAALKYEVQDRIAWRPHAQAFLDALHLRQIRRVLVTNAHPLSLSLKIAVTGLDNHLDAIICSHDFGLPKEATGFWKGLAQTEPFDPRTTLLVDDSVPVLANARRHGIARLLAVLAPDSRREPRPAPDFPSIHHFNELLPSLHVGSALR